MAMDHNDREFVERRINDIDRRRDSNLASKLDALEKLFNLTAATKAEAIRIVVDRLQDDNKGCMARCVTQVRSFNEALTALSTRISTNYALISDLEHEVEKLKEGAQTERSSIANDEALIAAITDRLDAVDLWRSGFFIKNFVVGVSSSFAVMQLILWGLMWLLDFAGKFIPIIGTGSGTP
ncbi:MAG: hypothetical protein PHY48_17115 [Candidatus Cloacimonetes bacterium]|nr:hypothetical protein [Candidatus Cloacimonadota bacterium]